MTYIRANRFDDSHANHSLRPALKVLDERYPRWYESIDLDSFDLMNPYHCVLGQMFSEEVEPSKRMHFMVSCGHDHGCGASGYTHGHRQLAKLEVGSDVHKAFAGGRTMQRRWKDAIRRRQNAR